MMTHALEETKKLCGLELQLREMVTALQRLNRLSRSDVHAINNVLTVVVAYEDLQDDELLREPGLLDDVHRAGQRAYDVLQQFWPDRPAQPLQ